MRIELITLSALIELATGLALVAAPDVVAQLLFAEGLSGPGQSVGRITGIALISLAAGRWGEGAAITRSTLASLLVYNVLTATYLAYAGFSGAQIGKLLWPAFVVHALLGLSFIVRWFRGESIHRTTSGRNH